MAQEKKMNESDFSQIVKELAAVGEMIRTHQEEKQAALDEFDRELARYQSGRISEKALQASVKKVNTELQKLDNQMRLQIRRAAQVSHRARTMAARQSPRRLRATMTGIRT